MNNRFTGVTPAMIHSMKGTYNNFSQAYTPSQQIIRKTDFSNSGNVMHNNIGEKTLNEYITEYTIHIDSYNRDFGTYPNPFKFNVVFGGAGSGVERKFKPSGEFVETSYVGQPNPKISRKFRNVKYIKLNHIILPKTNYVTVETLDEGTVYHLADPSNDLISNHKYLILKMSQAKSTSKVLSTNDYITDECFILYPDKIMGLNHYMWLPTNTSRVFPNSSLANIDKLDFEILDEDGNTLFVINTTDDTRFNTKTVLDTLTDPSDPTYVAVSKIHRIVQIDIELTLGVVENELNTQTNFLT